jgi:hypothetical protein
LLFLQEREDLDASGDLDENDLPTQSSEYSGINFSCTARAIFVIVSFVWSLAIDHELSHVLDHKLELLKVAEFGQ